MYEGDDMNLDEIEAPPEESGNNRAFLIGVGILGFLIFAALACGGLYLLVIRPSQTRAQQAQQATIAAQNEQVSQALTATAAAMFFTQSAPPMAEGSPTPSPTSVVMLASVTPAVTETPTELPATATIAAGFTQAAGLQLTIVPTSTALPGTGFADEVGAPMLLVMALALLAVILLARRLRTAPRVAH